jgi:hypothetical protein
MSPKLREAGTESKGEPSVRYSFAVLFDHLHRVRWLLFFSALLLVAYARNNMSEVAVWECEAIEPSWKTFPQNPCFRASISRTNLVTLEWRVVNAVSPEVYIFDDTSIGYDDPGTHLAFCESESAVSCSTSFRLVERGSYRWKIRVKGLSGNSVHIPATLQLTGPYPPILFSGDMRVDPLNPTERIISWTPDARNSIEEVEDAWIELKGANAIFWGAMRYPRSGPEANFTVPRSVFTETTDPAYHVRECYLPDGPGSEFCSPPSVVGFHVGTDVFEGPVHRHVTSGENLVARFSTVSGDLRMLVSPTLLSEDGAPGEISTAGSDYTIEGQRLTPGLHELFLTSCTSPDMRCPGREEAGAALHDGRLWRLPARHYQKGDLIALVVSSGLPWTQLIVAPSTGYVFFEKSDQKMFLSPIKAGEKIAHVYSSYDSFLHLLVDSSEGWVIGREYTEDFLESVSFSLPDSEGALDTTFDYEGNIWVLNEFSNSIVRVGAEHGIESLEVPLLRKHNTASGHAEPVKPFTAWLVPDQPTSVSFSSLAERVTTVGKKIWFTQGGGLGSGQSLESGNHSRVVSYDSTLEDSPVTLFDDRVCVYNVPSDDEDGFGNNQVIGLAWARGRIWIAEMRGVFNDAHSVVSSFVPNPALCDNTMDYAAEQAPGRKALQYCGAGTNPEQDGCVDRIVLDMEPAGIKVAHLETDPANESIWFSDASGQVLGNINLDRMPQVIVYPLPDSHRKHFDRMPGFGGFPWSIEVDGHAVYFAEYASRDILRFDKQTATFDEIHVPYSNEQVKLHSLALDANGNRLWFTLCNETRAPLDKAGSTIGYVDLASWQAHVVSPEKWPTIAGVVYSGLDAIPPGPGMPEVHQSFRGIAINPANGKLAIATMHRSQVTLLSPKQGFWP